MVNLSYDGSFEGFLTSLYLIHYLKLNDAKILPNSKVQTTLFTNNIKVETDREKAHLIWKQIEQNKPFLSKLIYFSFLTEEDGIENRLFKYITNYSTPKSDEQIAARNHLENLYQKISLEKKQLEYSTQLKSSESGLHYALLNPIYNTLPLLTREFKIKFGTESWIIADEKRKYGIACENGNLQIIQNPKEIFQQDMTNITDTFQFLDREGHKSIKPSKNNGKPTTSSHIFTTLKRAV